VPSWKPPEMLCWSTGDAFTEMAARVLARLENDEKQAKLKMPCYIIFGFETFQSRPKNRGAKKVRAPAEQNAF